MKIAVVIPAFRVARHVVSVVRGALAKVDRVYVVDDCCPERSGRLVEEEFTDKRVAVIYHERNQGVGGAVITGYVAALRDGCDVIVKMDGDGQMDPFYLEALVKPIIDGEADYTKGNRFFSIDYLSGMPKLRLFGNAALSFVNKVSSGYWHVMDPTNGYTAIHAVALSWLPLEKLSRRYFFESDTLFRLGTIRSVVRDVPIPAVYGDEVSNLKIGRILRDFPPLYVSRAVKRIWYNYILREINVGTIELFLGSLLVLFGVTFGVLKWYENLQTGHEAPAGTVMLASLPIILGVQFLIGALSFDVGNVPSEPLQKRMAINPEHVRRGRPVLVPEVATS